jgi:LysM repeat protein
MTAVDPKVRPLIPLVSDDPAVDRLARICPYLAAADGAWRSASVAREHRCGAVTPAAPLAAEKQRRLCLTDQHATCATFEAARAARPLGPERTTTLPRPLARTTPVVLDHGRIAIAVPTMRTDRTTGQAILILLMALAFVAIVLAKVSGGSAPAVVGRASASPRATAGTTVDPSVVASVPATGGPVTSSSPSTATGGSTSPSAPAGQTYKVKAGDTLIGIAAKFGTTPRAISLLNGITNPSSLKIGQTLKIP